MTAESHPSQVALLRIHLLLARCALQFIDDVEFWFRPENARVEYRSASRIGESDGEWATEVLGN